MCVPEENQKLSFQGVARLGVSHHRQSVKGDDLFWGKVICISQSVLLPRNPWMTLHSKGRDPKQTLPM